MAFFLQLFGGFRLVGQDGTLIALPERARALLSYLAMAPSPVSRQVLAELLSAEGCEQDQRTALRQAAYLARKAMADGAAISTRDSDLWLNDALVSVDVRLFQSAVARGDDHALAEAIDLYRGPFLAGEKSPSPALEEWLTGCRRDLLERALMALLKLASADEAAGRQDSALARARRAVALDPLCEEAHRQVMRCLAVAGHRPAALRQYTVIRQTLADELGAAPDSDTEALRETIARGAEGQASSSEARETTGEPEASTRPKRVMRLWNHLAPAVSWLPARMTVSRTVALPFALAAILLPVFAVAALWFAPPRSPPPTGGVSKVAPATEAPRLSIVVLPFANYSGTRTRSILPTGSQIT
jgi:DNA-binding SARP family transcriptional activator